MPTFFGVHSGSFDVFLVFQELTTYSMKFSAVQNVVHFSGTAFLPDTSFCDTVFLRKYFFDKIFRSGTSTFSQNLIFGLNALFGSGSIAPLTEFRIDGLKAHGLAKHIPICLPKRLLHTLNINRDTNCRKTLRMSSSTAVVRTMVSSTVESSNSVA